MIAALALVALSHVGSPDVFYEGDAGPYRLFVTVRTPPVIPGVATLEIRSASNDVTAVRVVPLRLTGPGSKLPPTADLAERSASDPQFFTASLWLMERGSLQVRISVDGARGAGQLAVPVAAVATRVLPMGRQLGAVLLGLMVLLAAAVVSIAAGGAREGLLEPGAVAARRDVLRGRIAAAVALLVVAGVIVSGRAWWRLDADEYEASVYKPPRAAARVEGDRLVLDTKLPGGLVQGLLPDHGHLMHLFVVREALDEVFHLHPERSEGSEFFHALPEVKGGRYRLFADVVAASGFPLTLTAELELPAGQGAPLEGDDSAWAGEASATRDASLTSGRMRWVEPAALRAGVGTPFTFRVEDGEGRAALDVEPYMGMAGHAVFVRRDFSVFAHVHPVGSVAMPALELAREGLDGPVDPHAGHAMGGPVPPEVSFPYGLPSAGDYRVFVQVKRAGRVETGVFDARVE